MKIPDSLAFLLALVAGSPALSNGETSGLGYTNDLQFRGALNAALSEMQSRPNVVIPALNPLAVKWSRVLEGHAQWNFPVQPTADEQWDQSELQKVQQSSRWRKGSTLLEGIKGVLGGPLSTASYERRAAATAQLDRACEAMFCSSDAVAGGPKEIAFYNEWILPSMLALGETLEHSILSEAARLVQEKTDSMTALRQMTVAIGKTDVTGKFQFVGSGFTVGENLYTCAHVVAGRFLLNGAILEKARLAVIFPGTNAFHGQPHLEVEVLRSQVYPEIDAAVIPLQGAARGKALEVEARVGKHFSIGEAADLQEGAVFVWGSRWEANAIQSYFVLPDVLYFPAAIVKQRLRPDRSLAYAYRNHLAGLIYLQTAGAPLTFFAKDWTTEALPPFLAPDPKKGGYTECAIMPNDQGLASPEVCHLTYVPEDPALYALSGNSAFAMSPLIRCFGIGLGCADGMSGSPVFKVSQGTHVLVGMYSGISAQKQPGQGKPTLNCFGKAVPFYRIKEKATP